MSRKLAEKQIDELVEAQAGDDSAWDEAIAVQRENKHPIKFPLSFDIVSDKNILDGTPVFRGTSVPVSALLDDLEKGVTIDEFIKNFPTVKREQAIKILELFRSSLTQLKAA